ncbi:type VII toxin-antitoxin system HepT family RNase toxin [Caldisericum exile]|uniref:DUF86 domain-containing protein n=1 Tax=Caldisericum exile (strain DSM 21853 / NBRC 104410 / AZM16c01) TaxID=511051 RepID=A0A7U6GFV7_CALEA|nr:hypothetical protein CSE_15280 [Caldisericum exile AZM16c01]
MRVNFRFNLGNPKNYRECIEILRDKNYIKNSTANELIKIVGLRNLLVHEYAEINVEHLFSLLSELKTFTSFISEIKKIFVQ